MDGRDGAVLQIGDEARGIDKEVHDGPNSPCWQEEYHQIIDVQRGTTLDQGRQDGLEHAAYINSRYHLVDDIH